VARSTYDAVSAQVRASPVVVLTQVVAVAGAPCCNLRPAFTTWFAENFVVLFAGICNSNQGRRGCQDTAGICGVWLQHSGQLSQQCMGECGSSLQEGKVGHQQPLYSRSVWRYPVVGAVPACAALHVCQHVQCRSVQQAMPHAPLLAGQKLPIVKNCQSQVQQFNILCAVWFRVLVCVLQEPAQPEACAQLPHCC
jgi:hypothetical protein